MLNINIKLLFKIIAMPAAIVLFLINVLCGVLIGLSPLVTNIVASLFLFGSATGWMVGAPLVQIWHCVGIGLFFLLVPHIANIMINKLTSIIYRILHCFTS